jgi:hypothetical protein
MSLRPVSALRLERFCHFDTQNPGLSRKQANPLPCGTRLASDSRFDLFDVEKISFRMLYLPILLYLVTNVSCESLRGRVAFDNWKSMNRTVGIRDAWHPQTKQDRDAILLELEQVLASPHFCNSKRYPALLQYVVENTLAGKSDLLKERTLGVEVFDRHPSYDTNADTIVRYTAGEVRKRLSLYYHELDQKPLIQISLPAGSYIPEFLHSQDCSEEGAKPLGSSAPSPFVRSELSHSPISDPVSPSHSSDSLLPWSPANSGLLPNGITEVQPAAAPGQTGAFHRRSIWLGIGGMLAVALLAVAGWRYHAAAPRTPLEDFWAPLLRDQRTVLVCSGGVVFKDGNFSGVITAGKDIDYPFISSQIASAIARVSGIVERHGATIDLQFSASTPLTQLREQPVVLLGGYNNQWTLRLLDPLPFHFASEPDESIVDRAQPLLHWTRDKSQPYSSADDYALVARFRDPTTDSWILVLAGLGRNGTEAAAQFVTSPRYMQLLRNQAGNDFSNRDVEALLKVSVIDGKTGAPSILAVREW